MNFTTQCGENRHTDIAHFPTLIRTKKLIHCVTIFTIMYGNYYSPHVEFKPICIGKFARRAWVNFTQQYGKNRQRCQQNKFYYAVWQLLLYYYREFPSKIFSVQSQLSIFNLLLSIRLILFITMLHLQTGRYNHYLWLIEKRKKLTVYKIFGPTRQSTSMRHNKDCLKFFF